MRNAKKTRLKIFEAAGRLLAAEGFESLGVNRIAAEAGVGKPLIYRYFGDFDGLVAALAEAAATDLAAPVQQVPLETAPPMAVLSALLGYGRRLASNGTARALLLRQVARADVPGLMPQEAVPMLEPSAPESGPDPAAVHAILRAAIVFLVICRDHHPAWDGLAMVSAKDMVRLEAAVGWIVGQTWPERQGETAIGGGEPL